MKTVTVFPQSINAKAQKHLREESLPATQTEAEFSKEKQETLRILRGDSVVIVLLSLCGGTPGNPAKWTRIGNIIRVCRSDIRPALGIVCGWEQVTHFCGIVSCRKATTQETSEIEFLEQEQGRDPRPWKMWRGRPVPNAPTYAKPSTKER